jgi:hypothetical protein
VSLIDPEDDEDILDDAVAVLQGSPTTRELLNTLIDWLRYLDRRLNYVEKLLADIIHFQMRVSHGHGDSRVITRWSSGTAMDNTGGSS